MENTQHTSVHQTTIRAMSNQNLKDPAGALLAMQDIAQTLTNSMKPITRKSCHKPLPIKFNSQSFDPVMLDLAWMEKQVFLREVLQELSQSYLHSLAV